MKWRLPELPDPQITEVVDSTGRVYTRRPGAIGEYWYSEEPGSGRGTYHWIDLLHQRGEVETVAADDLPT